MDTEIIVILLCTTFFASAHGVESIIGMRAPCSNEGEEVAVDSIKDMSCFKCICQNGFVECERENCPAVDDCFMLMKKPPGGCCDRCKECIYNGQYYASGAEWTDPDDPCASFKCIAGVVTESNIQCYTQCNRPLEPRPGQCCPTCAGCLLNGQKVLDGREVTSSEDPCLKCQCTNKRLTCIKKACPVLLCPISKQIKLPGECCPRCSEKREIIQIPGKCILGKGFHSDGKVFHPDHCSKCTCMNGTSICERDTCPVLECPPELQKIAPGDCCPNCPEIEEFRSVCDYNGTKYQYNQTWDLGPCSSCKCHSGVSLCAQVKCEMHKCRPNEIRVTPPGQCCSQCVESEGICTVFGDPHYKTFDGKFFSFQGTCKYQLTADCVGHLFSIRVTNDARNTKYSAWTKTVTIKLGAIKINLGQKLRIKVNGERIRLPFKLNNTVSVKRHDEELILVETYIGVKILWDGNNYLQIQAPVSFKNRLCGLCGNYNNVWRDDLKSRRGQNMSEDDIWNFANSWRVGGIKACARKSEKPRKGNCPHKRSSLKCQALQKFDVFGQCNSRLNPNNYFESCKNDMCECTSGRCYCESFAAYARECSRLGVELPNWRNDTICPFNRNRNHNNLNFNQISRINKLNNSNLINNYKLNKNNNFNNSSKITHTKHRRHRNRTKNLNNFNQHIPKTILYPGRTPLPLH